MWRNDKLDPNGSPTIDTVVICAEDEVAKRDLFTLVVAHVRAFRGAGFMPSVRSPGRLRNGDVVYGTDATALQKARMTGRTMLGEELERFERDCREFEFTHRARP